MNWLAIESAPFETDKASGCKRLPECLLLVNGVVVQGMMELGMWLRRCYHRPDLWEDLVPEPTHWMPKPSVDSVAPVAWVAPDGKGGVQFGKGWVFSPVATAEATMPVYANPVPSKVNMNQQVTATLTVAGARIYREWMLQFPARVRERVGAGGQVHLPLWEIAEIFGAKMGMGADVPFVDFEIDFGLPQGSGVPQ